MHKKKNFIPVNIMTDDFGGAISIERISFETHHFSDQGSLTDIEESEQSHRHDRHSFFLLESGMVVIEIDFETYLIEPQTIIYMHPDQVHRIVSFENVTVSSLAINNENLQPEYLQLLAEIAPAKPLLLNKKTFSIIVETISLSIKFSKRKTDKLFHSLLKDSCNTLVALIISQYLERVKSISKLSRFENINKSFKELLESNYTKIKRPGEYAEKLNLSSVYLNECVKNATGFPVSYHIHHRIILEAKRLLYHSNKSVKEISSDLGYDDYPYFSRLFNKISGMTPLTFRNKNLD